MALCLGDGPLSLIATVSVQAIGWALRQKVGDTSAKLILVVLANYAGHDHSCWPSQERIAAEAELSIRTVQRKLEMLEDLDLLTREHRGDGEGGRTTDLYILPVTRQPDRGGKTSEMGGLDDTAVTYEPLEPPSSETTSPPQGADAHRDFVFEALAEACYGTYTDLTKTERGRVNAAVPELKALGAHPTLVRAAARAWRNLHPAIPPTPQALTGNWHILLPPPKARAAAITEPEVEALSAEENAERLAALRARFDQIPKEIERTHVPTKEGFVQTGQT